MNALFIYRKGDRFQVLGLHPRTDEAKTTQSKAEGLLATGWKLTASIDSPGWLEHFLNSDEAGRTEALEQITTI